MNKILRFILATFCVCLFGIISTAYADTQVGKFKVQTCEFSHRKVSVYGMNEVAKKYRANFCNKTSLINYEKAIANKSGLALGQGYKLVSNGEFFVALNSSTRHIIPFPHEFETDDLSSTKNKVYYKLNAKKQVCFSIDGSMSSLKGFHQSIDLFHDEKTQKGICFDFNKKDGFLMSDIVDYKTMKKW